MKKIILLCLSLCFSAFAFAAENDRLNCADKMMSVGLSHPDQIHWVCRNATPYTVPMIDYAIRVGYDRVDSLAYIAGGNTTAWTRPCVDFLLRNSSFSRVVEVSMLCRSVSRDSYTHIYNYLRDPNTPDLNALHLSRIYSQESLRSLAIVFRELNGVGLCDVFDCGN